MRKTVSLFVAFLILATPMFSGVAHARTVGRTTAAATPVRQATLSGPVGSASNLLCPLLSRVSGVLAPVPVIGTLIGGLTGLVCDLKLLEFTWRTTVDTAAGPVSRDTPAVFGVPAFLPTATSVLPVLVASVTAVSTSQVTVEIDKMLFAPARLPVQVELIAHDPGHLSSDSDTVRFGYDGRPSGAPSRFTARLDLVSTSDPVHVRLAATQSGAGDGTALLGGIDNFDAGHVARSARLGYTPFPAAAGFDVTLGTVDQDVNVTTNAPATVAAHVSLINGADEQTIDGTIDKLPTSAEVHVTSGGADKRTVAYSANSPIATLHIDYASVTHGLGADTVNGKVTATVSGVPTGVTVDQSGPRQVHVSTSGGPVGMIEGGFATRGDVLLPSGVESGGRAVLDTVSTSVALRLRGLSDAVVDARGPYAVDLSSQTQPLHLVFDDRAEGRSIDATVQDLPAHLKLVVDPAAGKVASDGFGHGIAKITVRLVSSHLLFARVSRIRGTLTAVPAVMNLQYGEQPGGGFFVRSDNAVGNLEMQATDPGENFVQFRKQPGDFARTPADVAANFSPTADGFTLHDTLVPFLSDYALGVRVSGLRSVSVRTDPLDVKVDVDPALAQPFGLSIVTNHLDNPGQLNDFTYYEGWLTKLVPNMEFAKVPPDPISNPTRFRYTADAKIDFFDFRTNLGAVSYLHASVINLPRALSLCFGTSGDSRLCQQQGYGATPSTVAVDINDEGTGARDGITPFVDVVYCLDRSFPEQCPGREPVNSDESHDFATIRNLGVHRLELAFDVSGGALISGHLEANTDGQPTSGRISYYKFNWKHIGLLDYTLHASVNLPSGFSAVNRRTAWDNHVLTPPFYADSHTGTINCPGGTDIRAHATDNISGADVFPNDISGFLC